MNRSTFVALSMFSLLSVSNLATATDCPVEWYNQNGAFDPAKPSLTMAEEFGTTDRYGQPYDVQANTHCNQKKSGAKVVLQVDNHWSKDAAGKVTAFWLSTRREMLRNYAMQGMTVGNDVDVVVVLSTVGATLATVSHPRFAGATVADPTSTANPFQADVIAALDSGIKIYVCQTAARALGIRSEHLIDPRIQFVPGGHIAVADFQEKGYAHLMYK